MTAAVRVQALTRSGLSVAQKHGLRQDRTSQHRKVRDVDPLVYGSLDIVQAFEDHLGDARMNAGLKKPVLHALIQFPVSLKVNDKNQQLMLDHAVKFINENHGGDAVFAARLDRDESGQHTVDVFFCPKYEKTYKNKDSETWVSTTKHGKELCEKHREEIERRHGGQFLHGPRQVGISINSEFRNYLKNIGLELPDKKEKASFGPDSLSPEDYKLFQEYKKMRKTVSFVASAIKPVSDLIPEKIWAYLESFLPKPMKKSRSLRDIIQKHQKNIDESVILDDTNSNKL